MNPKSYFVIGLAMILSFAIGRYVYPSIELSMHALDTPNSNIGLNPSEASNKDIRSPYSDINAVAEKTKQRVIDSTLESEIKNLKDELSRLSGVTNVTSVLFAPDSFIQLSSFEVGDVVVATAPPSLILVGMSLAAFGFARRNKA